MNIFHASSAAYVDEVSVSVFFEETLSGTERFLLKFGKKYQIAGGKYLKKVHLSLN